MGRSESRRPTAERATHDLSPVAHSAEGAAFLQPWQFFLLGGMLAATATVIVATGQSPANIIILSLTVVSVSFVGLGVTWHQQKGEMQVFGQRVTNASSVSINQIFGQYATNASSVSRAPNLPSKALLTLHPFFGVLDTH